MHELTTVGIDLAKEVIAVCVLDRHGAVVERRVLRREAFERWAAQLAHAALPWRRVVLRTTGAVGLRRAAIVHD